VNGDWPEGGSRRAGGASGCDFAATRVGTQYPGSAFVSARKRTEFVRGRFLSMCTVQDLLQERVGTGDERMK
jgi:hypothetical protein